MRASIALGPLTEDLASWPPAARDAAVEELDAMARVLLPDLLTVTRHVDAEVRARAVRLVASVPQREATAAVVAALDDPELGVQRAALHALGERGASGSPQAVESASRLLLRHPDWSIRTEAAETLGRLGEPAAVLGLVTALRTDGYAFVREAAARSLRQIGGPEADRALGTAARSDPEPRVRSAASPHRH